MYPLGEQALSLGLVGPPTAPRTVSLGPQLHPYCFRTGSDLATNRSLHPRQGACRTYALFAYLQSLPAMKNRVPAPLPPVAQD